MKFVNFKSGSSGVPLWIGAEQIVSIQADDSGSAPTAITTLDGKVHWVQESVEQAKTMLEAATANE